MIACARCGASNGLGMTECRMCGSALTQSDAAGSRAPAGDPLDTTMVFKNLRTQPGTAGLTECLICPDCQTIGQIGWLFCPQCGKEVDASFLRTTDRPDQSTTIEATMSPEAAQAQISIQAQQVPMPPVQVPLQSVAPHQEAPKDSQHSPNDAHSAFETRQHAAAFQPEAPRWPRDSWSEHGAPAQAESGPRAWTPEPPAQSPGEHRSASAGSSNGATANDASGSTSDVEDKVTCAECGSDNSAHYSFCLNCGESLPVTRTVVMASIRTPASPRLRLLVQGESSGPTYEIKNETSIGRTEGTITFPRDNFMSSCHARIIKRGADFMLIDEASSNGTFIKVKSETKLESGDVILVGGQLLRYEA